MSKKKQDNGVDVDVKCEFGKLTFGDEKCSVPIKIERNQMTLPNADKFLCRTQLEGALVCDPNSEEDGPAQDKLIEGDLEEIAVTVETGNISFGKKRFSLTASFPVTVAQEHENLSRFACRRGRLVMAKIGDVVAAKRGRPAKAKSEDDDDGEDSPDDPE